MNTHLFPLALLGACALSTSALAQSPASPAQQQPAALEKTAPEEAAATETDKARVDFVTLDRNTDGRLSREETRVIAELEAAFPTLDSDQDQYLTPAEYARWNRAGDTSRTTPRDPGTAPGGSAGAQHVPEQD